MNTPFHLRKAAEPGAVAGLLLVSGRAADLLDLIATVADERATAYAVPGGFLVKLTAAKAVLFPNTIRLRALAADLFLPVDADLVPALLPDEAAALVRQRGLVFLPGGRVLGYAVGRPLEPAALLEVRRRPARAWRPLPERPARAERLREILLDLPDDTPDAILQPGGAGVGEEEPRPAGAGPLATAGGAAALGMGRALMGLGKLFGLKGLARLGAGMAQTAVAWAPRLSESLLGQQEAALRELLRRFREGDLEAALRRALPLGEAAGRGGTAARDAQLPIHNLFYSLGALLGDKGGRASVWLGGGDVQRELAAEYRKAAEAATARGDYRRAAFIYGKLLRQYALAAAVLARGGLHHDAAVLYLEKLDDSRAAAPEFAAAGEVDRAVRLYQQVGEHALAGDLLRQAGDDEAALREYTAAADRLAATDQHHQAGELMGTRAGRADLAREYFTAGWARRPAASAFPCLHDLARLAAEEDGAAALVVLTDEADAVFEEPGNDTHAGSFYNELARLADRANLASARDDLRDRALHGLAWKLRQAAAATARPGPEPSLLLGRSGEWPAAVVSDAAFAFRQALGSPRPAAPARTTVHLNVGSVTAACVAPRTGRLCVGFASSTVVTFDPQTGATGLFLYGEKGAWPVTSVAFDADGDYLIVLRTNDRQVGTLSVYQMSGIANRQTPLADRGVSATAAACLAEPVENAGLMAGLWDGSALSLLYCANLVPVGRVEAPFPSDAFRGALLLEGTGHAPPLPVLFDEDTAWLMWPPVEGTAPEPIALRYQHGWRPGVPEGSAFRLPQLPTQRTSPETLDVAATDEAGVLHWSRLHIGTFATAPGLLAFSAEEKYRAVAFIGPERIAGVRRGGVDWLRRGEGRLTRTATTAGGFMDAVACFHSAPTRELLVVLARGDVIRVPMPNA